MKSLPKINPPTVEFIQVKAQVEEKENVTVKIESVTKSPVKAVSKDGPSEEDIRRLNEAALVSKHWLLV